MTEKKASHFDSAELRRKAEESLGRDTGMTRPLGSPEDQLRLLHELQVHQIELEMQNAELRQARDDEATALGMYTDLYDFAPVSYLTLDRIGTIRAANLTGCGLMGVERSRLIGQRFGLFVATEARPVFADFLEKVFMSSVKEACELKLLKGGTSEMFVQIVGICGAAGDECRIGLIDITSQKRAEEVLRVAKDADEVLRLKKDAEEKLLLAEKVVEAARIAKEASEEAARRKNQFFANMSHELRTPMSGILGMIQLALQEDLAPTPRLYMETSQKSAQSLLMILNDILDMSKIEARKLTIEENPFSLRKCLTEAVDIITPETQRKGIDLISKVSEEVPDSLVGDQMRLRQVLINLIGNAVKFTGKGKVVVGVTTDGMTSDGKREYTFAIADTGIGIPDDKQDLLFQVFSQVDTTHSRKYGGTGLGLAICRELVELMGGKIGFESEFGVGSTFSFTIPLGEAGQESNTLCADESLSPEMITVPAGEGIPHLLLAEDDPTIRQVLEVMLTKSNYNLDIAEDGKKAVEMWERGDYDLVLMDVQMPVLNGFEATRAIREKERVRGGGGHTPIIAMTAHAGKEAEERCHAAGMDAYISKPIEFKMSLQLIGEVIRQKSSGD
jgi:signal transduction histidine kinase/ActR/RegA family two-component response regulator